jgi:hypothetical protein
VHCLFEQSGTFKNEFKKLGIDAEDYDILNDFGETDNVIDLFSEIEKAYDEEPSIFDNISQDDLILAFFPCTRFECQIKLFFQGDAHQQKNHTDIQKLEYAMRLHDELNELYSLICKLFLVSMRGGYKMIVENPYGQNYLEYYFPVKPKIIDKDRHANGDYFKKPTQYWFLNFEPQNNFCMFPLEYVELLKVGRQNKVNRSLMHPQYARRFIAQYILEVEGKVVTGEEFRNEKL